MAKRTLSERMTTRTPEEENWLCDFLDSRKPVDWPIVMRFGLGTLLAGDQRFLVELIGREAQRRCEARKVASRAPSDELPGIFAELGLRIVIASTPED